MLSDMLPAIWAANGEQETRSLMVSLVTYVAKNEKLANCTAFSLWSGLLEATRDALRLGDQAFLVPRWNKKLGATEATYQKGYKGNAAHAYRSGRVAGMVKKAVHEGDAFRHVMGSREFIEHERKPGSDMKPWTHVYAIITLTTGFQICESMTRAQVDQHRRQYCPDGCDEQGNPKGAWKTSEIQMAMKTVLNKALGNAPREARMQVESAAPLAIGLPPMDTAQLALEAGEGGEFERLLSLVATVGKGADPDSVDFEIRSAFETGAIRKPEADKLWARLQEVISDFPATSTGDDQ